MDKILVFGHKNPDTDSICSALVKAILDKKMNSVETVPAKAIKTNGNESNQYATAELPIVRTQSFLPFVHFLIRSISQALLSSPNRNPVNEAITIRGT